MSFLSLTTHEHHVQNFRNKYVQDLEDNTLAYENYSKNSWWNNIDEEELHNIENIMEP